MIKREIKNPLFDVFSGKLLDLKEGKMSAIRYFYNLLDAEICKGVTICVVPSSDSSKEIAVIGSRNCSPKGKELSYKTGRLLLF